DLEIKEDIAEEIGRLYGYDKLKLTLPERSSKPVSKNVLLEFKKQIRNLMLRVGANETVTYSFVNSSLIESVDQNQELAYKLSNALSPDIQYYRLSLAPSLLEKVHSNIKSGSPKFVLYEMSKVIEKTYKDPNESDLPKELYRLAIVITDNSKTLSAYYQAKNYLDYLMVELGLEYKIISLEDKDVDVEFTQTAKAFEPIRSGSVYVGNVFIGIIGEPKQSVKKLLKLPNYTSMIELDLTKLSEIARERPYVQLSNYPKIDQDICFKVPTAVKYIDLHNMAKKLIGEYSKDAQLTLSPIDIFQGKETKYKQITLRLILNSYTKTLKNSDLVDLMDALKSRVATDFAGDII
ncbi:MAG TPA: hypothetical protein VII94_01920, partial [Candidatus Saccharimonadales bacterium]